MPERGAVSYTEPSARRSRSLEGTHDRRFRAAGADFFSFDGECFVYYFRSPMIY